MLYRLKYLTHRNPPIHYLLHPAFLRELRRVDGCTRGGTAELSVPMRSLLGRGGPTKGVGAEVGEGDSVCPLRRVRAAGGDGHDLGHPGHSGERLLLRGALRLLLRRHARHLLRLRVPPRRRRVLCARPVCVGAQLQHDLQAIHQD